MSNAIMASGDAFPGYKLTTDNLLESEVDDAGDVLNPDLIVPTNFLCEKCEPLMKELEARYTEFRKRCEVEKNIDVFRVQGERCRARKPYYNSMDEKRQAVDRGCYICAMLFDPKISDTSMDDFIKQGGFQPPANFIDLTALGIPPLLGHPVELQIRESRRFKVRTLSIERCKSNDDLDERCSVELSASNASQTTFQLIASWLQPFRDEQHVLSLDGSSVPKRLVDVGLTDQSQIRIIYPRDQILYLTVSHCWGEPKSHGITLNDDTHKSLTEGYEYSKLPRLLRDCVHVTRRLGFRYVWIDSLCIRQDNEEEKMGEINKMGDIYAGSFCNILAVSAKDGRSSLFTKDLPLGKRCHNTLWEMQPNLESLHDVKHAHSEPLYERAWVLQERLLAPRAIAYTHEGVIWHCNDSSITGSYAGSFLNITWNSLLELRSTGLAEEAKVVGQDWWMEVVKQFSESNITDEKDRKRALLGVISVLQKRTGLSIVCGVCEDFLPYSLLPTLEAERPQPESEIHWSILVEHLPFSSFLPTNLAFGSQITAAKMPRLVDRRGNIDTFCNRMV